MKPLVAVSPGARIALGVAFFVLFVAVFGMANIYVKALNAVKNR